MTVVKILPLDRPHGEGEELHLLSGCAIDHDGPANVTKYFTPTIEELPSTAGAATGVSHVISQPNASGSGSAVAGGRRTASFRGRLMRGAKVASSEEGYKFYVLEKEPDREEEGDAADDADVGASNGTTGGDWRIVGSAEHINYWKHHVPVDPATDAVYRAMGWLRTAKALHSDDD